MEAQVRCRYSDRRNIFQQGMDFHVRPSAVLQYLLSLDLGELCKGVEEPPFDAVVLYVTSFSVEPDGLVPVFPANVQWSLRTGVSCDVDDLAPTAETVTNLASAADLGTGQPGVVGGRNGELFRVVGCPMSTLTMWGAVDAAFAANLTVNIRVLPMRLGPRGFEVTVGGAAG